MQFLCKKGPEMKMRVATSTMLVLALFATEHLAGDCGVIVNGPRCDGCLLDEGESIAGSCGCVSGQCFGIVWDCAYEQYLQVATQPMVYWSQRMCYVKYACEPRDSRLECIGTANPCEPRRVTYATGGQVGQIRYAGGGNCGIWTRILPERSDMSVVASRSPAYLEESL